MLPQEFCEEDSDCPSHGGWGYTCVDDRCLANDLPDWVVSCTGPADCQSNDVCYAHAQYGQKVCVPKWSVT